MCSSAEVPEEFPEHDGAFLVATTHPSAVLRADNRAIAYASLLDDLRVEGGNSAPGSITATRPSAVQ